MVDQVAVSVIANVKPETLDDLKAVLATIGRDVAHNEILPFAELSGVHFARFVVLDPALDLDGRPLPPQLVYFCDVDGALDRHLADLVDVAGPGLDQVYRHCEGYPTANTITRRERLAYLRSRLVTADAIYVNTRGRTVQQIRQEAQLRDAIEAFLDQTPETWEGAAPAAVRTAIQQFVDCQPSLRWARQPAASLSLMTKVKDALHLAGVVLLALWLSPLLLLVLPLWLLLLRRHELRDRAPHDRPDPAHVRELAALEDWGAQNQFSAVGYLKPGRFRLVTAVLVLWVANFGTRHFFQRADLAGVKSIHFARWVFLDGRRRLIFASNYDGSLESYMDDFIDKVAWGLNAVFSNGVGYPKTRWLLLDGAWDELAFKDFLRIHQIVTPVWFAAYDRLTALNVEQNARIREGLYGPLDAAQTEQWLRLL